MRLIVQSQESSLVVQHRSADGTKWSMLGEALDKSAVAELSAETLNEMTCEELVRVIGAADLSTWLTRDRRPQLPRGDRDALLRMAFLARRCCRNQGY
jgi:hypothetical protein